MRKIEIPEDELAFRSSRASGPGGQNVNKVESKVTVIFDYRRSRTLSESDKARLDRSESIASRIDAEGCIVISSQEHRTQLSNRRTAVERLNALLQKALTPRKVRRATKPTKASKVRRRDAKERRSTIKKNRGRVE